jgi:hypothetical protein
MAVRSHFGRNKLYQMSMFTLDLEEQAEDPLQRGMSSNAAFRVSGIDPSVTTHNIVRCMNGLTDDGGRRVNFDVVWVDDTTFIVAARYRPSENEGAAAAAGTTGGTEASMDDDAAILGQHGDLIFQSLRARFRKEEILSLEEYFREMRGEAVEEERPSWVGRLLQMVGFDKRKATAEDVVPTAKRRRQS